MCGGSRVDEQPSLGQFIWMVRQELQWAHEAGRNQSLRFDVESVALDLVVDASKSGEGGGSLDLKVLGVGLAGHAGVERSRHDGTTVHVVLTARDAGGRKYQVGAADREPPARRAETVPESSGAAGRPSAPPDLPSAAEPQA
jgi:hypothetical protein